MPPRTAKKGPRSLHRYLRAWRIYRDMTQIDVGEALNVRHSTVSRWEAGSIPINIFDIERLAALYGVEPVRLLTDPNAPSPPGADRAQIILSQLDESDRADWLRSGERLTRR